MADMGGPLDRLRSLRFRQEREYDWVKLEELVAKITVDGRDSLTAEECLALPRLYRAALSGLSVARAISLDTNVVRYLEALVLKSYMQVYGSRARFGETLVGFFVIGWPQAVRRMGAALLVAFLVFAGAWGVGHSLVSRNPEWFYVLAGGSAQERTPTASRATLCETVFEAAPSQGPCKTELKPRKAGESEGAGGLSTFASFLFTNNAQVSLLCFALGFAFGIPTLYLLFFNGIMGGAMTAVFFSKGVGIDFVGWLTIHGTTEIFAIVLCGAAGLHMGTAAALPGTRRRVDAVAHAGRTSAVVAMGGVVMLAVAALLEGFGRQLIQPTSARFVIGGIMLLLWCSYFLLCGRGGTDGQSR